MAKSVRSKWKKRMAKAKAEAVKPQMMERLKSLNNKLHLVAQNKISTVPMQEPCKDFHFSHPALDPTKRLKLSDKFTTNIRKGLRGFEGNADGSNEIRSAKKLKAQYHVLPSQLKAAMESTSAEDAAQNLVAAGFLKADADDDAVVSMMQGGFDHGDDDDNNNNNDNNNTTRSLPKAADVKRASAKKMKADTATGNKSRLVAGGKKQNQYKKK